MMEDIIRVKWKQREGNSKMQKGENENKNETEKHDWYTEAKGSSKYLMIKHIFPENVFFCFCKPQSFTIPQDLLLLQSRTILLQEYKLTFFLEIFSFFSTKNFFFFNEHKWAWLIFAQTKKKWFLADQKNLMFHLQ